MVNKLVLIKKGYGLNRNKSKVKNKIIRMSKANNKVTNKSSRILKKVAIISFKTSKIYVD